MTVVDLVLRGCRVMTPDGLLPIGLALDDGMIVAMSSDASLPKADRVLDLSDRIVLPGFIDTHSHLRDMELSYKEDYETGTKAAAAGGVTAVIDMPNTKPPTNSVERLEEKKLSAATRAVVDYGFLAGVTDNRYGSIERRGDRLSITYVPLFEEIPKLAAAGVLGYKIFLADGVYPHPAELFVNDDGVLLELFEAVAKTGLPCSVHPVNSEIYDIVINRERSARHTEPFALWRARNYKEGLIWSSCIANLLSLQRATGVRLNVLHLNTAEGIELVRKAKADGSNVTAEANPQHLFLKRSDIESIGPLAVTAATDPNREALWEALPSGVVDVIGTDHAPHGRNEIEAGWKDIFRVPLGSPTLQEYAPLLLTAVNEGRIALEAVVRLCAENPAKIFGLHPRKGTIRLGSDADLVIVDMGKRGVIRPGYSKCGYTAYEGREVKGVPVMTIVRGVIAMQDGEITTRAGSGRWLSGPRYSRERLQ